MIKTGYFDVVNGCAGDMLVGSIIDAGLDLKLLENELKKLPIKNYRIEIKKVKKETSWGHFIEGTQFFVKPLEKWDDRTPYKKILKIVEQSSFEDRIKEKIFKIFDILAENESIAHKEKKEKVHFHQIGQIDAIVEIASAVLGIELLGIKKIFSSPVGLGNPAPVTCEILKGVPVIFKNTDFEISTPTGVAILKGLADFTQSYLNFYIEKVGYGAGTRDEPKPNVLKFLIGYIDEEDKEIIVIETNIDDMNPVFVGNLINKLLNSGAVDVSVFQGIGKKNRPVFKIEVICREKDFTNVSKVLFEESTTIGFRFRKERRLILKREIKEIETEYGKVRVKFSYFNGKIVNISPEFEDCRKISDLKKIPLKKVFESIYKKLEIE